MTPIVPSAILAAAARRELAQREQLWPREVASSRATEAQKEADLAAWARILAWSEARDMELLTPARAAELAAILTEAESRRWQALVPEGDNRHPARAQRLLDTNALAHAFDCWRIRQGWARAEATSAIKQAA